MSSFTDEKERFLFQTTVTNFALVISIGKLLECEIAETCLPPVALPKAHQSNICLKKYADKHVRLVVSCLRVSKSTSKPVHKNV